MKVLSIIIATFNVEKTIGKCLDSLTSQKTDEIELIIVDGGSKDNSLQLFKQYKNYIDILISEPDKGIYDAWNKGIKHASGDWIMFLGADDFVKQNVLPSYVEYVKGLNGYYDIVTARAEFVDFEGKLIKVIGQPFVWEKERRNMGISHGSTLHNKRLFERVGLYSLDFKICADYELLLRDGANIKGDFYDKIIIVFKIGGASFSIACQRETFKIRKLHHTIPICMNMIYCLKRVLGIFYKKFTYKIN